MHNINIQKVSFSYTRFQMEEMFKILIIPDQILEEYFLQMKPVELKRGFKSLALLLHPDKNAAAYAKVAFQKVFSIYERCKAKETFSA